MMIENDVNELIAILSRDEDKTFAEAVGDSLRTIIGKLSQKDSPVICGLIIGFGLKGAMQMLESAINFTEAVNET